ncbi:hypothetical protein [Actinorhabdospora filicis]|nr:hypothetical protein [Actinorhabdospora filicis]
MIVTYGVANFLQAIAANKVKAQQSFSPRLLWRLAAHKTYVLGVALQSLGFILAFMARGYLPLFLVQASVAAGIGITAVLGVLILKWRLPRSEILLLTVMSLGIVALVVSARPSPSDQLTPAAIIALVVILVGIAVAGYFCARLQGVTGSVVLGGLAGLAFGAASVASRPLANFGDPVAFVTDPLLYLMIIYSLTGQLLLAMAMQRGSTTASVASMDAAFAAPAAVVGLLLLGDQIAPGREWLAALGFLVTLGAIIALTRYAEPQAHERRPLEEAAVAQASAPPPVSSPQPGSTRTPVRDTV